MWTPSGKLSRYSTGTRTAGSAQLNSRRWPEQNTVSSKLFDPVFSVQSTVQCTVYSAAYSVHCTVPCTHKEISLAHSPSPAIPLLEVMQRENLCRGKLTCTARAPFKSLSKSNTTLLWKDQLFHGIFLGGNIWILVEVIFSYKAVCRTALATPGLLNSFHFTGKWVKKENYTCCHMSIN